MVNRLKKIFNIASIAVVGSMMLWNCESDADMLGSQFFNGADAVDSTYALIAYNVSNQDSIRTDAAKLDSALIGAFTEGQFGMQKASYITQLRLSSYAPDLGTNAVLDSAVLVIKPAYYSDSVTTTTTEDYTFNDDSNENVASKKVVNNYLVKKYGKTEVSGAAASFNIKVHEVTDFLGASTDRVYSNKAVNTSNLIGSKSFNGKITSVTVTKDSDDTELYNRDANLRIKMDSAFFQNKIIAKANSSELADAASFIRYFKGLKVSVDETDGYMIRFKPDSIDLKLYYKYDYDNDGTVERKSNVLAMSTGSANAHFSQIEFNRTGTPSQNALATIDTVNGDSKLYVQGAGGPGAGFKIPQTTIASLRSKYENDKIGIISAKIRVYTDPDLWNNSYTKPNYFVIRQKNSYAFLNDISTLANSGNYYLVRTYDLDKNPAYYDFGVTQTVKDIVENGDENEDLIINVGSYTYDSSTSALEGASYSDSQNYNTRPYTPHRAVLVGTVLDPSNALYSKGAKLLITYGQK